MQLRILREFRVYICAYNKNPLFGAFDIKTGPLIYVRSITATLYVIRSRYSNYFLFGPEVGLLSRFSRINPYKSNTVYTHCITTSQLK